MTDKNNLQLTLQVLSDSITNNKALLGGGAFLGLAISMFTNGAPKVEMASIYHCFASTKPYMPYLYAAATGALVLGIGKIVLNSFCQNLERVEKETPRDIL
jgi:hypothetical protein